MLTDVELADTYVDEVKKLRIMGWMSSEFWVVDFTYNSQRRFVRRSFGVQGAAQPILHDESGAYTDCFVLLVSNHGNTKGPFMFTADAAFGTHTVKSKTVKESRQTAKSFMKELRIAPANVIYWGDKIGKNKKYVAESSDIVSFVIHHAKVENLKILRDDGNAHKRGKTDLWAAAGCNVFVMAPETHADLSPLDNMLWAYAKKKAATKDVPRDDHVKHSLTLLRAIIDVPYDEIQYWFSKNFMVGIGSITQEKALAAMRGDHHQLYSFHRDCLRLYHIDNGTISPDTACAVPNLKSALDGAYWFLQ
jgi:hypothetical protein